MPEKTEIFDEFTQFNSNNKCRYLLHYNLQKPINLKLTAMKVYVPEKLWNLLKYLNEQRECFMWRLHFSKLIGAKNAVNWNGITWKKKSR